jgi:hypothetical protein
MRAARSVLPPGGTGTTMRTGLSGHFAVWAFTAGEAAASASISNAGVCLIECDLPSYDLAKKPGALFSISK